ncbi:unnamed protein product [Pleuronectes platessa]|uniref:Uncharacterized protein n=1 Tax=Pleuronectes platessa TaxID=8262 RepID=A0A9N7VG83_PLEPL|nr:unnamed protein product [Pleuronectes platessa]
MHTPNIYPTNLHQSPGSNQVLANNGLHAARVHHSLVFTPLNSYWNSVCCRRTREGCCRASNPDHLSRFHGRTRLPEVPELPAPPTLLPWHSRRPLRVGSGACSGWELWVKGRGQSRDLVGPTPGYRVEEGPFGEGLAARMNGQVVVSPIRSSTALLMCW